MSIMFRKPRTYLVSYHYVSKGEGKRITGFGSVEWTTRKMDSKELIELREDVGNFLHRENPLNTAWSIVVLSIYKLDN